MQSVRRWRVPFMRANNKLSLSSSLSPHHNHNQLNASSLVLLATAGEKGEEAATVQVDSQQKWMPLPPVPALPHVGQSLEPVPDISALRWVLKCCPHIPRSLVERLFRQRMITKSLTDEHDKTIFRKVSKSKIVAEGSVLYIPKSVLLEREPLSEAQHSKGAKAGVSKRDNVTCWEQEYELDDIEWVRNMVIHMDAHVIALNKPSGLATQGGAKVKKSLESFLGPALSFKHKESPKLVHRLDKDTSGAMVVGRTSEATTLLHALFHSKTTAAILGGKDFTPDNTIVRRYWALVVGRPSSNEGRIIAPLKKVVLDGGKSDTIVIADNADSEDAIQAITEYTVLGPSVFGCTWLELRPLTGRKHQLRVHCAEALGTPIVGDHRYGRRVLKQWLLERDEDVWNANANKEPTKISFSSEEMVEGSVSSKAPLLHLHSRVLVIPEVRELAEKTLAWEAEKGSAKSTKRAFIDKLRLVAPLPAHMKASWELLPPRKKAWSSSAA